MRPSSSDDGRAVYLPDPCDHERTSPSRWLSGLRAWRVGATMIACVVAGGVLVERRSRGTPRTSCATRADLADAGEGGVLAHAGPVRGSDTTLARDDLRAELT